MNYNILFSGLRQGKSAVEQYTLDCTNNLPSGASVSATGHTITHTPPTGGTATTITPTVSGNKVTVPFGTVDKTGLHFIDVVISYANASGLKPQVRLEVDIPF